MLTVNIACSDDQGLDS